MCQTTVSSFFCYVAVLQGYSELYVLIIRKNVFTGINIFNKIRTKIKLGISFNFSYEYPIVGLPFSSFQFSSLCATFTIVTEVGI